jgi:hypothetical protein
MFALLASHPSLSMVRRSNIWRWFNQKFGDLADPANLENALHTLERYTRLDQIQPDWPRIRTEFDHGEPTYARLFDLMHGHHAARTGRSRWGDKSLHSEYFASDIFSAYPEARVVQLIRDPRDRYVSISNRYDEESKGISSATGRWLKSVRAGQSNQARYRGRYLVVRFEDLAREPVATTSEVCAFFGEEFDPAMMAMTGAPEHEHGNSSFTDLAPKAISTKPIGRYRTLLSASEIAFIQLAAGRAMRRLDYELDPVEFPAGHRVEFALRRAPLGMGRMAAWSVRERVERTRATPPERRLAAERK